jgi:transposase
VCRKLFAYDKADGHHLCRACNNIRRHPPAPVHDNTIPPDPSPPSTLFDRDSSPGISLTEEQRWAIITLHREGHKPTTIAERMPCDLRTVNHWIKYYVQHGSVTDQHRCGRRKKTDENTNINIAVTAHVEKFITPKKIKRELDLVVSTRTVRRRLNEAGLVGRISRKEYPYTDAQIKKRISFAQGYGNWTVPKWRTVLFSDETHVSLGEHGQVHVQRPAGEAFNSEYMSHKVPHPDRVSVWSCFSAGGVGGIEIFTENLNAKCCGNHNITRDNIHWVPVTVYLFSQSVIWCIKVTQI